VRQPTRIARWRDARGSELIEFAFALPVLIFVLFGILDMGFCFRNYEVLTNAAREGARLKALSPNYTTADVQSRVGAYLTGGGLDSTLATTAVSQVSIPLNPSGTVTAVGNQVTVQYPYQLRFLSTIGNFFGGSFGNITLSASSTMRNLS